MTVRKLGTWCAVLTIITSASVAGAATITLSNSFGSTNGGEFRAVSSGLPFVPGALLLTPPNEFETFCIEVTEQVSYGQAYSADISTQAVGGGAGGGSPDPLHPRTAYLYERFITGALADYTYDDTDGGILRGLSADALQAVIWYLEDETDKTWTDGDNSLKDKFYQDALNNAGSSIGNVRVLNLYHDAQMTQNAQDQLVLLPEPGTILLALVGLGLLACPRRRITAG